MKLLSKLSFYSCLILFAFHSTCFSEEDQSASHLESSIINVVSNNNIYAFNLLLDNGEKVVGVKNKRGISILNIANSLPDKTIFKLLSIIKNNFDETIARGNLEEIKELLEKSCTYSFFENPNAHMHCKLPKNNDHQNALIISILREKWDVVLYLSQRWHFQNNFFQHEETLFDALYRTLQWLITCGVELKCIDMELLDEITNINACIRKALKEHPIEMQTIIKKLSES